VHELERPARYWDAVVDAWNRRGDDSVWRAHSDAVNTSLVQRWLQAKPLKRVLKTDLFDEAVSRGVFPFLETRARRVTGIDVSNKVVEAACARYPALEGVTADVLRMPFRDAEFDAVVSISTLDHFDSPDKIYHALGELHRVLVPGGTLVITLDNGTNPAVAVRNWLPHGILRRLRLIPYRMGVTCTAMRFLELLRRSSFEVRDVRYTVHCPRAAAVLAARVVQQSASAKARDRFLRLLGTGERLDRLPTRALTGYFVAALATRS
jgi:SAM-dependent methyltransferase